MNKKTFIFIFLFYLVIVFFAFGDLTKTFFQQDEWATFGNMIYASQMGDNWLEILLPMAGFSHFAPFSRIVPRLMFTSFGTNFLPYALLPLIFQIINSFLVFYLAWLLSNKKSLAFLAGLFFALNSFSRQTIIWIAASTGAQGSALFLLVSLIFLVKKRPVYSTLAFLFSLFFKETSIFLFAFLPIAWLILFSKKDLFNKKDWQRGIKFFKPLWLMAFFYLGLRLLLFFNAPTPPGTPYEVAQPTDRAVYIFRFFTHPLKALAQTFISVEEIITFSRLMIRLAYPWFVAGNGAVDPYVAETVGADIFSYAGALLVFSGFFLLWRKVRLKEKRLAQTLIFSLIFILMASSPLLFISGRAGYFSLVEGRHLYLLGIGSSLFLAVFFFILFQHFAQKKKRRFLLILVLLFLFLGHGLRIQKDVRKQISLGNLRRSILEEISQRYPQLPEKVVFYTESNTAYYGLPPEEKILPFQSGLGQTLLIWYYGRGEKLPFCFFLPEEDFLYALTEEGYLECLNRGFGFFRDFTKLREIVLKNKLPFESVIAFSFNSRDNSLREITSEIRKKL